MGMSTYVLGFKPRDEKYDRMLAVWESCRAAKVEVPDEVNEFFEGESPDPAGVKISFRDHEAVREYHNSEMAEEGFEVDVTKLPADVTLIRFVQSW